MLFPAISPGEQSRYYLCLEVSIHWQVTFCYLVDQNLKKCTGLVALQVCLALMNVPSLVQPVTRQCLFHTRMTHK